VPDTCRGGDRAKVARRCVPKKDERFVERPVVAAKNIRHPFGRLHVAFSTYAGIGDQRCAVSAAQNDVFRGGVINGATLDRYSMIGALPCPVPIDQRQ